MLHSKLGMSFLRHSGLFRQYIQTFSNLALQLPDMGEKDKLDHFLHNLSLWARLQVKLADPTDLTSVLRLAEKLADVEIGKPKTKGANAPSVDENANEEGPSTSAHTIMGAKPQLPWRTFQRKE